MQARADKIIEVKSPDEIKRMKESCLIGLLNLFKSLFIIFNIARKALDIGHKAVKPGVTTDEIDKIVHEFIISQQAYPSPLNYRGFPKSICTYT